MTKHTEVIATALVNTASLLVSSAISLKEALKRLKREQQQRYNFLNCRSKGCGCRFSAVSSFTKSARNSSTTTTFWTSKHPTLMPSSLLPPGSIFHLLIKFHFSVKREIQNLYLVSFAWSYYLTFLFFNFFFKFVDLKSFIKERHTWGFEFLIPILVHDRISI